MWLVNYTDEKITLNLSQVLKNHFFALSLSPSCRLSIFLSTSSNIVSMCIHKGITQKIGCHHLKHTHTYAIDYIERERKKRAVKRHVIKENLISRWNLIQIERF